MALSNDDLFLVNDSQDGNKAKKIKYSTLKSDIETDVGASDLQAVTDVGNTTTNGATFGGDVGIGTDSPAAKLHTVGSDNEILKLENSGNTFQGIGFYGTGDALKGRIKTSTVNSNVYIEADPSDLSVTSSINFSVDGTERAQITSNGSLGIGGTLPGSPNITLSADGKAAFNGNVAIGATAASSKISLRIRNDITGAATSDGVLVEGEVQPDVTNTAYYFRTVASTEASAFTASDLIHVNASQGTFGAGSTVTNQYGFRADNSLNGATNNYGFYSHLTEDGSADYNFYAAGTAPNFLQGSAYIGGNTTRNTRELWESLLTDEQKEELAAGTLAIPANVSTPGDGSFARQWWYDQQSAEDQALIDSGEFEYPERLQPANFTDVFALGDNTNIDLNSNGSASFSGNVTTPEVVLDKTNNYGAYGRVYLNSGGANDFGVQLKHHSNSTVYDAGVFLGGTSVNQAGRIRFYTSRNPGTDDAIHSACIESNGSFTIGGDSSGWNPSIALTASGAGNFNGVITTKKVVKRDTVATIANSTSFSLLDSNFWVTAADASTVVNPTDIQTAMSGLIYCTAEVTAWGDKWKWPGGVAPEVPANSVVPYYVKATDEIIAGLPTKEYA